jgi:HpcH/HpaI aldolase/citrate lyase family
VGPAKSDNLILEAQHIQADYVRVELELGLTFLDIAEATREAETARRCIHHAITALRTANHFLAGIRVNTGDNAILYQYPNELRKRIVETVRWLRSGQIR